MRNIIPLLICLLFINHGCISFKSRAYFGTVKFNETLFVDEREMDIETWISYYSYIYENEGIDVARKVLPDLTKVDYLLKIIFENLSEPKELGSGAISYSVASYSMKRASCMTQKHYEKIKEKYKLEESYYDAMMHAITGITFEQVVDFCKWRTEMMGDDKLIYRLPTENEWYVIAQRGFNEIERKQSFRDSTLNNDVCRSYNYRITIPCQHLQAKGIEHAKIENCVTPPTYGIDLSDYWGNVSEMISTKGKAKGGNYLLYASQCQIDSIQVYSGPEQWLGFRCVGERKTK
jgi:hypothetical protein